jgi:tetratricopeptide (TPR) repeat protein
MNRTDRRKTAKSERSRIDENLANGLDQMRRGDLNGAQRTFQNILSIQPRNADALRRLGSIAIAQNQFEPAEDFLRRSLIVRPSDAETHNDLAFTLQQIGKMDEAIQEYEKAIDLDASRIEFKTNYGSILIRAGRGRDAEVAVDAALLINDKDPRALFLKGLLCKASDRIDEAIDYMEQAVLADPILRDAHLNLSEMRFYKDGGESFITSYKEAYEKDTSDPRCALLYTEALHKCGRYNEIEAVLNPFMEGELRKHPSILNGMAYTLASQGKFDRALPLHKEALQVAHQDPVTHQNYARTLVQSGDYRSAIEQLRLVAQSMPLAQDMLALTSTAYQQLKDPQADVLNDRARLIFESTFVPEKNGGDLAGFNASLVERISTFKDLVVHPFEASKRISGTVRQGFLSDTEGGPAIKTLTTFVGTSIRDFIQNTPENDKHPFLAIKTSGITGAANHYSEASNFERTNFPIEKHGFMRGFYFLEVPEECEDGKAKNGWLHFGEPDFQTKDTIVADFEVKPEPGKIVLFPAYMWHGFNALSAKSPLKVIGLQIYGAAG